MARMITNPLAKAHPAVFFYSYFSTVTLFPGVRGVPPPPSGVRLKTTTNYHIRWKQFTHNTHAKVWISVTA